MLGIMRRLTILFLCVLLGVPAFSGCQAPKHIADSIVREIVSQATDLSVPSIKYRSENGRWPKDYSELSAFAQQSGGHLRRYNRVEFTELPGDRFQIYSIADGSTNLMTFTYRKDGEKK